MASISFENTSSRITNLLRDLFDVAAVYNQGDSIVFSLTCHHDPERSTKLLADRLKTSGYRFTLDQREDMVLLTIDPKPKLRIPMLNLTLFVLTLGSVYFVPVFIRNLGSLEATLTDLAGGAGIEFAIALISMLLVHEMGHFVAGRRRGIVTSWPYFIPAPSIIGTFGAVIKSKSPFSNRRDLIEVGAAGPIAGWVVAAFWLLYGLSRSTIIPIEVVQPGEMVFTLEGESILMRLATLSILGPAQEGSFYRLTEAAFAGWVGLLVTAINLLPIGQLDGGHIMYGLLHRGQRRWGRLAMVGLLLLGFQSPTWWFFAAFGLVFGVTHPPTMNDAMPTGRTARRMGIVAMILLVLSFTPVPFR